MYYINLYCKCNCKYYFKVLFYQLYFFFQLMITREYTFLLYCQKSIRVRLITSSYTAIKYFRGHPIIELKIGETNPLKSDEVLN